ncbi:uncharacterized protein LOC128252183 [Drosophila gunungcola]|uniref:uncharacterized protein LOC128252183 n=1 Tax=Drosophila gunungcola TaxID=103775 RepID=UPI0022E0656F|nr:uncharacterized protein LOC128252183 [Drosophila gunungcola]
MSTRRHFGIALLLCSMSLSYNYRLIDGPDDPGTCPARNKDPLFEEPHLSDQQRNFYNVHEIPRRLPNSNSNEIKSENWLLRIINFKTGNQKPSQEVPGSDEINRIKGFARRFLNILGLRPKMEEPSYKQNSEPKIFFILKKHREPKEQHIFKREPEQYNVM